MYYATEISKSRVESRQKKGALSLGSIMQSETRHNNNVGVSACIYSGPVACAPAVWHTDRIWRFSAVHAQNVQIF